MNRELRTTIWVSALLLAGCAAAPPAPGVPIANAKELAGKWVGTVTALPSGAGSGWAATIKGDGTWTATAFDRRFQGTFTVAKGDAHWRSNTTGAAGTWVLRRVNGRDVLDSYGDSSRIEAHRTS